MAPPPKPGGGAFAAADGAFAAVGAATEAADTDGVKERKLALIGLELGPSEGKSSAGAAGVGLERSPRRMPEEDEGGGLIAGLDLL